MPGPAPRTVFGERFRVARFDHPRSFRQGSGRHGSTPAGRRTRGQGMTLTETRPETETEGSTASPRPTPTALERLVGTGSYASIGRLYIGFSLVFALVAGVVRLLVGLDIATDNAFLEARVPMLNASS